MSWPKTEKAAIALFVLGILASLIAFVHPWYDLDNDASMYIVTARALARGEGYTYMGEPFRVRPPGFSAILAPVIAALGTNFYAFNLLCSLFGAAAVLLLFLHQRSRVGWVLGLVTAAAVWLNPGYQRMCNKVMSDVPGLALLLGCLLLERWASQSVCWRREAILGGCIGLSALLRSANILLVPAIIVSRLLSRPGGGRGGSGGGAMRLLLAAAVAGAVLLPWAIRNSLDAPSGPADQTLNYSISTAMWHTDPGDPNSPRFSLGEILHRFPMNSLLTVNILGSRIQSQIAGGPLTFASAVTWLVALMLLGSLLIVFLRRRAPAEIFAAGTLLVVAFYFSLPSRLLLAVFVIAFAAAVEVLSDCVRRAAGKRAGIVVTAVLVILLAAVDFKPHHDWAKIEAQHRIYTEIASAVSARLQSDARLASSRGFHYSVFLDRPVYSMKHAIRRAGLRKGAEAVIDKYSINTVVLSPLDPQDRALIPYFQRRYGSGLEAANALVWRVRPG